MNRAFGLKSWGYSVDPVGVHLLGEEDPFDSFGFFGEGGQAAQEVAVSQPALFYIVGFDVSFVKIVFLAEKLLGAVPFELEPWGYGNEGTWGSAFFVFADKALSVCGELGVAPFLILGFCLFENLVKVV